MTTEQPRPLLPTVSPVLVNKSNNYGTSYDFGLFEPIPNRCKLNNAEVNMSTPGSFILVLSFLEAFGLDDELEKNGETRNDVVDFAGVQEWSEHDKCFCFAWKSVIVWTQKRVYFLVCDWEDCFLVSGPRNPEPS